MMTVKRKIKVKGVVKWHSRLAWLGGIALMLFAFSGLLHPIMVWTGPKAAAFFPPQIKITPDQVAAIPDILAKHRIAEAKIVKLVASQDGPLLQVTQTSQDSSLNLRRYFDLAGQQELANYDVRHARWLAGYYTGLPARQIRSIDLKTEFDNDYPWVNRLLPVYRIVYRNDSGNEGSNEGGNEIAHEGGLVAFVHTETNALAGLSNDWKRSIQTLFSALHTWNWMDSADNARVTLMTIVLSSVIALAITGTLLVFKIRRRKIKASDRRRHRMLGAYLLWLPLLGFSLSGLYHLLQTSVGDNYRGLHLGQNIDTAASDSFTRTDWVQRYETRLLNGAALVQGESGNLLYRLSFPQGKPGKPLSSNKRFDGTPIERNAIYIDPQTGEDVGFGDREQALRIAKNFFKLDSSKIIDVQLITRFGVHYDFRNKRLPVWQITLDTQKGELLFVDPATGILVDRLVDTQRYEGYSFSFLHKWNFLRPLVGREVRDVLLVTLMLTTLLLAIFGIRLKLQFKNKLAATITATIATTLPEAEPDSQVVSQSPVVN